MPRRRPRCWRAWRTKFNLRPPLGQALPPTPHFTGKPWRLRREAALDSAAHVKAAAQGASHADHDEILVTLTIDPGYHLNANPASIDYLIPTVVTVPSAPDAKITYPAGQVFKPKFSPEGISVYEGSVAIRADLPKGSLASPRARRCALRCRRARPKSASLRQLSLYLYLSSVNPALSSD